MSHDHKLWKDQIPFYIAESLPPAQRRAFEEHLAQCDQCQAELAEWRVLASAVWAEADNAARQLPPLSQEVYNRLGYRDRPPSSRHSANPPRPAYASQRPPRHHSRNSREEPRRFAIPLTLVASFVTAVLVGGLLLATGVFDEALNPASEQNIAQNATPTGDGQFGSSALALTVTPTPTAWDNGVLPTPLTPQPQPTITPDAFVLQPTSVLPPTVSPIPPPLEYTPPPGSGGASDASVASGVGGGVQSSAVQGVGPYITLTPGLMESGAPVCYAINPTDNQTQVPLWSAANRDAPPTGYILPDERYRTLVRSPDGWYQVFFQTTQQIMWIAPQDAILEGNCSDLWLATPTPVTSPTAIPATSEDAVVSRPPQPTIATVQLSFVDMRGEPDFGAAVQAVGQQGEQFSVIGYSAGNAWVYVRYVDGRELWVPADGVRVTQATGATPTMNALPNP